MLIVALQYHHADFDQAVELARFMEELEDFPREDVTVIWASRNAPTKLLTRQGKFPHMGGIIVQSGASGWPAGCNAVAKSVIEHAPGLVRYCSGILLLEPDCVPLQKDWLTQIIRSWDFALLDGAWVMGSWRDSGGQYGHINGCCVVRPDFYKLGNLKDCPPDLAWDCYHSPYTREHWARSGLFKNCFQSYNATEEILRTPETGGVPPCLVHGFKDQSAMDISKKWNLKT